jgi:hypothetical protein
MAHGNLQEARLGIGQGRAETISENRRGLREVRDLAVPVLRLDDEHGKPRAVLFNFSCHPVSLHSYRNLFSPDYPGYTRSLVRKVLGDDVVPMFTLGAAGDINPARYFHGRPSPVRSQQIGEVLGCEVLKVALDPSYQPNPELHIIREIIELPLVPLPPLRTLREMKANFIKEAERLRTEGQTWERISREEIQIDWASDAIDVWENGQPLETMSCEVQAIRIGEVVFLTAPLEAFTETSLAIRQEFPSQVFMFCTNSNGGLGYLPTPDAYAGEDYTNPDGLAPRVYGIYSFSDKAESLFRERAINLIKRLLSWES